MQTVFAVQILRKQYHQYENEIPGRKQVTYLRGSKMTNC